MKSFHTDNFHQLCRELASRDTSLAGILDKFSYPPMWSRPQSYATLIHIILEQQVSLASALSAFNKLSERLGTITPEAVMDLTDEEMRGCYFSRQKVRYAKELATAMIEKRIDLQTFQFLSDEEIRRQLKTVKGIGDWTVDIYLLFALQRADVFPTGDLAMIKAFRKIKNVPPDITKEEIIHLAQSWRPYRSIATMMLWHFYLSEYR